MEERRVLRRFSVARVSGVRWDLMQGGGTEAGPVECYVSREGLITRTVTQAIHYYGIVTDKTRNTKVDQSLEVFLLKW